MPSKDAFPKPKRNAEAIRDAAPQLRLLLEHQLAYRMPAWTVQSTRRGLGVDIRQGKDPIALVWWDVDGWWCRRWPTPGVKNVEPIHDMDDWTESEMTAEERYTEIAAMTVEQLLDAIAAVQWPDGMPR